MAKVIHFSYFCQLSIRVLETKRLKFFFSYSDNRVSDKNWREKFQYFISLNAFQKPFKNPVTYLRYWFIQRGSNENPYNED